MKNNRLNLSRFADATKHGLRVFPVRAAGKEPAVRSWKEYESNPATSREIAAWDASDDNVGVVCGEASGVVIVDVDSPQAQEVVDALNFPETPCVKTAKGRHYYFRYPQFHVGNAVRIGDTELDIRGSGGYVVGAGSVHPSGALYEWVVHPNDVDFAKLPDAIVSMIVEKKRGRTRSYSQEFAQWSPSGSRFDKWLRQRLDEALHELGSKAEGERNDTLFRCAVRLACDVAATGDDWAKFASELASTASKIGLHEEEAAATLASAWRAGSETPTSWIALAQDWIYVSGADQFHHLKSGERLSQQAFRTEFNHLLTVKQAGNIARFLTDGGYVDTVQNTSYDPTGDVGIFEAHGRRWLNTYRPSTIVAEDGDTARFAEFVEFLVPNAEERDHFTKMIAHLIRKPGEKLHHALIFGSRDHGIGKSTFLTTLFQLMGSSNCRKATTEEIDGPYQSYIEGKLLVLVEEINFGAGRKSYNKMKDIITAEVSPVRRLYQDVRDVPNMASFIFLTNLEVPILIEPEDRRFFVIDTPAVRRDADYYSELHGWLKDNLGVVRSYFDAIDLDNFNPHAPPPMTAAKNALIEKSRAPVVQELLEMIDERMSPFHVDIVSLLQVNEAISRRLPKTSRNALHTALRQVGAVDLGQHRISASARVPTRLFGMSDRPSLWAVRHADYWRRVSPKDRVEEYLAEESLLFGIPDLPKEIGISPADWSIVERQADGRTGTARREEEVRSMINES